MKIKIAMSAVLLASLVVTSSCGDNEKIEAPSVDEVTKATENRYIENEIRDYEGIRLDPSVGPRDNSIRGTQYVDIKNYSLLVTGMVDEELSYSYDEVLSLPSREKIITLHCVEGWNSTVLWKGVLLEDIIEPSGIDSAANTIIFHCADEYTTSLPLSTIIDNQLMLAYSSNGIDLPPELGYPFIFIAEDKLGYKWARWITEIEVSDNQYYRGYWEGFGYDNEADLE